MQLFTGFDEIQFKNSLKFIILTALNIDEYKLLYH
jgi:hypothetical protein